MINPNDDGVTHINVYTKGKTELGRLLSNLAATPFTHPIYGEFKCVEGFWYMYTTGNTKFQTMDGWTAKREGNKLPRIQEMDPEELKAVYKYKLKANPDLAKLLLTNTLPLEHYYVYEGKVVSNKYTWTAKLWETIKAEIPH